MWRDRSKDTSLAFKKVKFQFVCICKYCTDTINKIFLLKQLYIKDIALFISYQLIDYDYQLYTIGKSKLKELTLHKSEITNSYENITDQIDNAEATLNNIIRYKTTYVEDNLLLATKVSLFNLPPYFVGNTLNIIKDLKGVKKIYKQDLNVIEDQITKINSHNYKFEALCKNHDNKVRLVNLNAYNLETTDKDQINIIKKYYYYKDNLFTSALKDNKEENNEEWRENLRLKCCKGCSLFGHVVEKCYTKHCHYICRVKDCPVDNCKFKLYKCTLDHCFNCYSHSHTENKCTKNKQPIVVPKNPFNNTNTQKYIVPVNQTHTQTKPWGYVIPVKK
jgi:hypothetical protein